MAGDILILGASARAAAASARRAGLSPWAIDLFADRDLKALGPASRLNGPYPAAFLEEQRAVPPMPWLVTGALENHPALLASIAAERPFWGVDPTMLAWLRDPAWLRAQALAVGLPSPSLGTWPPGPGRWIVKPRRSGGGTGVRLWSETLPEDGFVQEYIEGEPVGAVFCGTTFLGASRQLIGTPWLNATGFRYAGSIGPIAVPDGVRRLGERLGLAGVRGLYGIDGLLRAGEFWPVELNPRYTASVEILEHASGLRAMAHHAAAFGAGPPLAIPTATRAIGKAILYAARDGAFPKRGPWTEAKGDPPPFADLPEPGSPLIAGWPVLTMMAAGPDCEDELRRMARAVEQALRRDEP